jgi:predicted HicB family RNase H-like nuclease
MAKGTGRTEAIKVRITKELRAAIEELAAKDNRSLSSWIETALKRVVDQAKRKKMSAVDSR